MPVIKQSARLPVEILPGRMRQTIVSAKLGSQESFLHENILKPEGYVPQHRHSYEEVLICLSGLVCLELEETTYMLEAGDVAIIPAGTVHSFKNASLGDSKLLAFFPKANHR